MNKDTRSTGTLPPSRNARASRIAAVPKTCKRRCAGPADPRKSHPLQGAGRAASGRGQSSSLGMDCAPRTPPVQPRARLPRPLERPRAPWTRPFWARLRASMAAAGRGLVVGSRAYQAAAPPGRARQGPRAEPRAAGAGAWPRATGAARLATSRWGRALLPGWATLPAPLAGRAAISAFSLLCLFSEEEDRVEREKVGKRMSGLGFTLPIYMFFGRI
jgi:hypothetical protein